ncbi:unnamed protein product [Brassicogethes aeneus]|uniref:CHK kinase-like domain-containing protein n=1 Tax=Brassicogethes aeneus TaxID=1431903 RepID=A0A9P0AV65_BRAAE|nr:unnamed protein product [Brassicogethes aeneus]
MNGVNNINSIVDKIAKSIPLDEYDVEYGEGNEKGEGYLGEMSFVKITPKKNEKTYNIAIKRAFTNKSVREDVPIRQVFLHEVFFYKECCPILQQLQSELDLPKFNNVPKCFYTSTEPENEYLAMENLKTSGFELFPKEKIIPYDHFEFIFKIYANLHATSFVLGKTQPEKFEKFALNCKDLSTLFFSNSAFNNVWNNMIAHAKEKLLPGQDYNAIKDFEKKFCNNALSVFMESWIYNGGSKDTFDRLDDLLQVYYKSFSDVLKKAGLNSEEVYPYSLLKEEWKTYCIYGWIMSLTVIRIKLTNQEDKVDLIEMSNSDDKEEMAKKMFEGKPCEEYDRRVRELILHVHEIGAL